MRQDRKNGVAILTILACLIGFALSRSYPHTDANDMFDANVRPTPSTATPRNSFDGVFIGSESGTNVASRLVARGTSISWVQEGGGTCTTEFVPTLEKGDLTMHNPRWTCSESPVTEQTILAYSKAHDHWLIIDGEVPAVTWTFFDRQ